MAAKRLRYERDHTRLDMDSVDDGPGSVGGAATDLFTTPDLHWVSAFEFASLRNCPSIPAWITDQNLSDRNMFGD